jgi:hypothetical protein
MKAIIEMGPKPNFYGVSYEDTPDGWTTLYRAAPTYYGLIRDIFRDVDNHHENLNVNVSIAASCDRQTKELIRRLVNTLKKDDLEFRFD